VKFREFRALARDWEAFGKTDPLFGILSDPTKFGGKWDVDEFFESGRAHVQHLFNTLGALGIEHGTDTCLDFGCGVGRLTVGLADRFARTVGVDVAPSMVERAREFHGAGSGCEFVVNRHSDLRQFPSGEFDLVHTCLVLQHIPPEIALRYVSEFFRVAKAGGLVVFQLPAERLADPVITAMHTPPDDGYVAGVVLRDAPTSLATGEARSVMVAITNASHAVWRHDIPAGRHICIANHWLREDGTVAAADDGRARLPRTLAPGESIEIALPVTAPAEPGRYVLEVDLVHELICWFAEKGSPTARFPVIVEAAAAARATAPYLTRDVDRTRIQPSGLSRAGTRQKLLSRIIDRLRPERKPSFSMFTVPRAQVEAVIVASGGRLLEAVDDNAAGAGWRSYTYVCRKSGDSRRRPADDKRWQLACDQKPEGGRT
jgi:SAM-dependent methyltransferase